LQTVEHLDSQEEKSGPEQHMIVSAVGKMTLLYHGEFCKYKYFVYPD
jgi:hypothetical protein